MHRRRPSDKWRLWELVEKRVREIEENLVAECYLRRGVLNGMQCMVGSKFRRMGGTWSRKRVCEQTGVGCVDLLKFTEDFG